jgi:hypothetical protein
LDRAPEDRSRSERLSEDEVRRLTGSARPELLPRTSAGVGEPLDIDEGWDTLHKTEIEGPRGREQRKAGPILVLQETFELLKGVATQHEPPGFFMGRTLTGRLPSREQNLAADESQTGCGLVQKPLALEQLHEPIRRHHGDSSGAGELGGVSVVPARSRQELTRQLRGKKNLQHPLVQVGEEMNGLWPGTGGQGG